jgi:hypothetical protein
MQHICDKCMAKLVDKGARPHFEIYGNGTRWTMQTCSVCGEQRECVWRPDLVLVKEVSDVVL